MGNIGGLEVLRTKTTISLATEAIDRTSGEIMTNLRQFGCGDCGNYIVD